MSTQRPETRAAEDPHAQMERAFIEEYLRERGYSFEALHKLPERLVKQLLTEASTYASNKLSEMEARAHFVNEVHGASPPL